MNENEMTTRSRRSFAAFIFTILFVFHVMLIPVWFGISALMTLGSNTNQLFEIIPRWFFGTGITCLILALVLHYLHRNNHSATGSRLLEYALTSFQWQGNNAMDRSRFGRVGLGIRRGGLIIDDDWPARSS